MKLAKRKSGWLKRMVIITGVPSITVIVDVGWSKRAHKHSYNAKSGVRIIIGQLTGKLLHLGVINIVLRVQMAFQLKSTNATRIGINRHLKWRLI